MNNKISSQLDLRCFIFTKSLHLVFYGEDKHQLDKPRMKPIHTGLPMALSVMLGDYHFRFSPNRVVTTGGLNRVIKRGCRQKPTMTSIHYINL